MKLENDSFEAIDLVGAMAFGTVCLFAWLTHVSACLETGAWGLWIAGTLFFPIGIIHGASYWFGS